MSAAHYLTDPKAIEPGAHSLLNADTHLTVQQVLIVVVSRRGLDVPLRRLGLEVGVVRLPIAWGAGMNVLGIGTDGC